MDSYEENRRDFKKEIHLSAGAMVMDRYRIIDLIDRGGFCYTYRAMDTRLNIEVALKEFFPHGVASRVEGNTVTVFTHTDEMNFENGKRRFLREARGLAQFNQISGIVSVYDYFEYNSTAYIVMEFLKGQNLKRYMSGMQGNLDSAFVYDVARKMCEVLKIIHSNNVIHRDISPDNIFLCEDGTLKLIDFGALNQDYTGDNSTVTVILKQGYAPFEQYYDDGKQGPWTDIYALGATLYNLCTGRVPQQSVARFNQNNLIPPHELNPNITRNFSMAIMKAMSLRMEDRYQSADEFENALFDEEEHPEEYYSNEYIKAGGVSDDRKEGIGSKASFAAMDDSDESEHTYALFSAKKKESEKEEPVREEKVKQDTYDGAGKNEKEPIIDVKKNIDNSREENIPSTQPPVKTVKKEKVVITPNGKAVTVEYEEPVEDGNVTSIEKPKKTVKKEKVVITPNGKAVTVEYEEPVEDDNATSIEKPKKTIKKEKVVITPNGKAVTIEYEEPVEGDDIATNDKGGNNYNDSVGRVIPDKFSERENINDRLVLEDDKVYVMNSPTKSSFWTKKKVAVFCSVGIALIGLGIVLFNGLSSKNAEEVSQVFTVDNGFFCFDDSLFGKTVDQVNDELASHNLGPTEHDEDINDSLELRIKWVSHGKSWIHFYFYKNTLVEVDYAERTNELSNNILDIAKKRYGDDFYDGSDKDGHYYEWEYTFMNKYNQDYCGGYFSLSDQDDEFIDEKKIVFQCYSSKRFGGPSIYWSN